MSAADAKDLIKLLSDRSVAWQALWTVFYTVSAAFVGIVASGKLLPHRRIAASLLCIVAYLMFATGNYVALEEMRKQRESVVKFVKAKAAVTNTQEIIDVADASAPPQPLMLILYHWGLTLLIIILLFSIPHFLKAPADS